MIFAERKPIDEIVASIKGHQKVLLLGCATCVAECAAGGEREVQTLAPLLSMAMQKDGAEVAIEVKTIEKQCEWEFLEEVAESVAHADAILSLACGIGVQTLAERYEDTPVYPGVNTSGLTVRQEEGLWEGRCAACGDCVLGETFGLCPVSRCAKSLMNGPCGGTRDTGKCELNEDVDCVWGKIVERAKSLDRLEELANVRKAKDWSGSGHGGVKRVLREELRP